MRRIFHADLDAFFVSVEEVLDPSLKGKPVIVGGRDWRGVVACASYAARRFGIYAGMPLGQARRLCPGAIFLEGKFSHYREASERFYAILEEFTPFIEPVGIDEAYMDMTGFESLYGPPAQSARRLRERVSQEMGLAVSVGIASSKLVAKIASDAAKPDGLREVAPGGEEGFLRPLPVSALPGVGPRTQAVLKRMGVGTIGELAGLSPSLLRYLFGVWGAVLYRHARGIDPSPVAPPPQAKSVSRSTTLMEDTRDLAFLEAVLGYLSERVGMELRRMGKRARCVTLKVRYADFETVQRQRMLLHPTHSHQLLFRAARELLHRLLEGRGEPVRLVGIGASQLVAAHQLPLWEGWGERLERLNTAIDSVRSRFGFTALQTGRTFALREAFPSGEEGYLLHTPALSR